MQPRSFRAGDSKPLRYAASILNQQTSPARQQIQAARRLRQGYGFAQGRMLVVELPDAQHIVFAGIKQIPLRRQQQMVGMRLRQIDRSRRLLRCQRQDANSLLGQHADTPLLFIQRRQRHRFHRAARQA